MNLNEAKTVIEAIESRLQSEPFVIAHIFERNGKKLHLGLTDRLRRIAKRRRVWKSKEFLTAFKNAEYGFDETNSRSLSGLDGIFLLDRNFTPRNEMMRKIFDRFLDSNCQEIVEIANLLNTNIENLRAVRLVSHHLRLLGLLHQNNLGDWLILIDYDNTK